MQYLFQLTTAEFEALLDRIIEKKLSQLDQNKKSAKSFESEELLKIGAVARYFQVTPKTIHNWVDSGKIIRYHKGGRSYYKRSEIEMSLEQNHKQQNFKKS